MDELDDYIKKTQATITPSLAKITAAQKRAKALGHDISDDVATDFFDVAFLESGRSHYDKAGRVKESPTDPKDGQKAIGFGQIKPGTIKKWGNLDPYNEEDNITGSLLEFNSIDSRDPIARRIGYFSGSASGALKHYRSTGQIPRGGDFTGTSFQKYIERTNGFKSVDDYIRSAKTDKEVPAELDGYIDAVRAEAPEVPTSGKPLLRPGQPLGGEPTPTFKTPMPLAVPPVAAPVAEEQINIPPETESPVAPVLQSVVPQKLFGGNARVSPKLKPPRVEKPKQYVGSEPVITELPPERPEQTVSADSPENAVAFSVAAQSPREGLEKLAAQYPGIDVEKVLTENPNLALTRPGTVDVTYGDLARFGVDTAPLIRQKVVEERTENPQPDLEVGRNWAKEDAEALNEIFGPTVAKYAASVINSGGNTAKTIAGLLKIVGDLNPAKGDSLAQAAGLKPYRAGRDVIDYFKDVAQTTGTLASATGSKYTEPATEEDIGTLPGRPLERDTWASKGAHALGTLADVPRLALLPGSVSGPVLSFATDSALMAASEGEDVNWSKVRKEAGKGALLGAVSMAAPGVGRLAERTIGQGLTTASKNILREGITLGTLGAGTYTASRAMGDSEQQAFDNAVLFSALHAVGQLKQKVRNIPIRIRDVKGNEAVIKIEGETVKTVDPKTEAQAQITIPKDAEISKPPAPMGEKEVLPTTKVEAPVTDNTAQPEMVADTPAVEIKANAVAPASLKPRKLNFTQFAIERGLPSDYDVLEHGRLGESGRMSNRSRKFQEESHLKRSELNQQAHLEFEEAIRKSEIVDSTGKVTKERLLREDRERHNKDVQSKIATIDSQIRNIEGLGSMSHLPSGKLKAKYQRTVDAYRAQRAELEATLQAEDSPKINLESAKDTLEPQNKPSARVTSPEPVTTLTAAQQTNILNRFSKQGDLSKLNTSFHKLDKNQKAQVLEAVHLGKDPKKAISTARKSATELPPIPKNYSEEMEERHGGFPFLNSLFGEKVRPDSLNLKEALKIPDAEVEARMSDAEGIKQSSGLARKAGQIKTAVVDIKNAFRRTFPQLDPKKDNVHAVTNDLLRQLSAAPAWSKAVAADKVAEITENLGKDRMKVFTRALILPDIIKDIENGLYEGKGLPFGFKNKAQVEEQLAKYDEIANNEPAIKDALERRAAFNKSLTQRLVDLELLDSKVMDDPRYFHRQVMAYVNDPAFVGTGSHDVRVRQKGFQKERTGGGDFNTRYVEAEHEWVSQALSIINRKESLTRIKQTADIKADLELEAKTLTAKTGKQTEWSDLIPEGYTVWQPEKGSFFYPATSVTERTLDKILHGGAPLESKSVKKILAQGGKKEQWVIPDGIAATLERFAPIPSDNALENLWTSAQASWKQWVLINPVRVLKYNLNNMSGDVDIAMAYDPKILKGFPKAAKDLWGYQVKGKLDNEAVVAEIQDAMKKGVVDSGLSISEIPDINNIGAFRFLTSNDPNLIQKGVERFWGGSKTFTNWRENILRLTAYRYFKEKIDAGQKVYGASSPKQIDAITEPHDKAAKLARELVGDYGAVSVAGQWIRRNLIPFYSWIEVNTPRYARMLRNTAYEERGTASAAGRTAGVVAKQTATNLVTLGVKANLLYVLAQLWNNSMFPEEEKKLRGEGSRKNHLIYAKGEDGSVKSIRVEGAMADALEWFGLDDYPSDIQDLRKGEATLLDKGAEAIKSPVNRIVNAWEPFSKTTFEMVMGRQAFPTIFEKKADFSLKSRPIRDRAEYAARLFSLDGLYRRVTGRPRPPSSNNPLENFLDWTVGYRTDPDETAYWESRGRVSDFQKSRGRETQMSDPTDRANALYYYKQALKWKDEKAAEKYLAEYFKLGGSEKGLNQSIARSHPLGGLAKRDWSGYLQTLNAEQRSELKTALDFYKKTYQPGEEEGVGEATETSVSDLYKMIFPKPVAFAMQPSTTIPQIADLLRLSDLAVSDRVRIESHLREKVMRQLKQGNLTEDERRSAELVGIKTVSEEENEKLQERKRLRDEKSSIKRQLRLGQ